MGNSRRASRRIRRPDGLAHARKVYRREQRREAAQAALQQQIVQYEADAWLDDLAEEMAALPSEDLLEDD